MEDKDYKELIKQLENLKAEVDKVNWTMVATYKDFGRSMTNDLVEAIDFTKRKYGNYLVERALEGADDE